jgi:hypothetical protein
MARRFKNIDRDTPMLLPPDLRDWVGEDDRVHFVIAAVERLPLSRFAVNYEGCGDEQYPPHLLLALVRVGALTNAPELYVSVHREDADAERRYEYRPAAKINPPKTLTDPVLLAMAEKLNTEKGRTIYRQRACTFEPVFGSIKHVLGFRQFLLRGLQNVSGEWDLVCVADNLKRLHSLQRAGAISRIAAENPAMIVFPFRITPFFLRRPFLTSECRPFSSADRFPASVNT